MISRFTCVAIVVTLIATSSPASAGEDVFQDVIVVTGVREPQPGYIIDGDAEPTAPSDSAALVGRLPGVALVNNGRLSGQVEYRGLFGTRVGTTVNGQHFHSGGPNAMDPPLHYAPPVVIDRVEVSRGPGGIDDRAAFVGAINAIMKEVPYQSSESMSFHYDISMLGRSVDSSYAAGGIAGFANDRYRLFTLFSDESGQDVDFPGGRLRSTSHERTVLGLVAGMETSTNTVDLEVRSHNTGATGNPPFAMDIEYVETDFARVAWTHMVGEAAISLNVGYSDVDHGMNNYGLRPAPATTMRFRRTVTGAETFTASLAAELPTIIGSWLFGIESERAEKSAVITNPNNADFWLANLPSISLRRSAMFTQWSPSLGDARFELGARVDRHTARAGEAMTGSAVPMMPGTLATAFNASDRSWDDTTVDLVARAWMKTGEATWRAALSRRHRAPGYVERFAWLPTPASGGLADGNTYVGDLSIAAEVATTLDVGVDLIGERWSLRPTLYYSLIDDYIQGVPFDDTPGTVDSPVEMVSMMNGDPTPLRFGNVDARLYGLELDGTLLVTDSVQLGMRYTHARGERRDIDDALYRITPPRLSLSAQYMQQDRRVLLESVTNAHQGRVSRANSESGTGGFTFFNALFDWHVNRNVDITIGVENLTDKRYRDHLAGYNRVAGSDVGLGERLYGYGRNFYVKLQVNR